MVAPCAAAQAHARVDQLSDRNQMIRPYLLVITRTKCASLARMAPIEAVGGQVTAIITDLPSLWSSRQETCRQVTPLATVDVKQFVLVTTGEKSARRVQFRFAVRNEQTQKRSPP